jgi:hypothetical protein
MPDAGEAHDELLHLTPGASIAGGHKPMIISYVQRAPQAMETARKADGQKMTSSAGNPGGNG